MASSSNTPKPTQTPPPTPPKIEPYPNIFFVEGKGLDGPTEKRG